MGKKFQKFFFLFCLIFSQYGESKEASSFLPLFNKAVSLHQKEEYRAALKIYKRVLPHSKSMRPVVLYYMAQAYKHLGKEKVVLRILKLLSSGELPKNLRKRVDGFAEALKGEPPVGSPWWGAVQLSGGSNSNPEFLASDSVSEESEGQAQYDLQGQLGYEWSLTEKKTLSIYSRFQERLFQESDDSNYGTYQLASDYEWFLAGLQWVLTPDYTFLTYGGDTFSHNHGLQLRGSYSMGSTLWTMSSRWEDSHVEDEDFSYLEGTLLENYLQGWLSFGRVSYLGRVTFGDYRYTDNVNVSPSFESLRFLLQGAYQSGENVYTLGLIHELRSYLFDATENKSREDIRWTFYASVEWSLNDRWSWRGQVQWMENQSNFDETSSQDKNFQQFSVLTGPRYQW